MAFNGMKKNSESAEYKTKRIIEGHTGNSVSLQVNERGSKSRSRKNIIWFTQSSDITYEVSR